MRLPGKNEEDAILTQAQIDEYNRIGAIVVPHVLSADEVHELRRVTDEFVENSRTLSRHDEIYDLEDSHSANEPRVRRIKMPHLHHPAYGRLVQAPEDRLGAARPMGAGYSLRHGQAEHEVGGLRRSGRVAPGLGLLPHTNDNLAAVGVMMDDMALENGPLMIVPGTHRGPDLRPSRRWTASAAPWTPRAMTSTSTRPCPLTGQAGSITVHHVRAVHGSAPNVSAKERRLLLLQYRAADAWPLLGFPRHPGGV